MRVFDDTLQEWGIQKNLVPRHKKAPQLYLNGVTQGRITGYIWYQGSWPLGGTRQAWTIHLLSSCLHFHPSLLFTSFIHPAMLFFSSMQPFILTFTTSLDYPLIFCLTFCSIYLSIHPSIHSAIFSTIHQFSQ